MTTRRRRLLTLAGAAAGCVLFAYAIQRAGVTEILDGIRRVGWGLAAILVLGGLRFAVRAECWRLCMTRAPGDGAAPPLRLSQAFNAFLAGDAVGNVTPLGLLASEPTKVFLARHQLATRESVSSLALENLVYAASVVAMIAVGIAVLLTEVTLPAWWRWAGAAGIAGMAGGALAIRQLLQGTWDQARGERPRWRATLSSVRQAVVEFSAAYRGRLWRVFALDLLFHASAVAEIYLTLQWLVGGAGVTWTQAIVFEALNRVITVAFKFVPFRVGIDEALSGALAPVLAVDPAAGVALAVVRKIRNLFWSGAGLAIVAMHPTASRGEPATDPRESATARRS